jgi:polysaccharide export outer membrane protein
VVVSAAAIHLTPAASSVNGPALLALEKGAGAATLVCSDPVDRDAALGVDGFHLTPEPPAALASLIRPVSTEPVLGRRAPQLKLRPGAEPPEEADLPLRPVGAEDLLEISVFEIPELNRTVRVTERGTISLPLLGDVPAGGLTPAQLETRIREKLAEKYLQNPQVSVFVREYGSKRVSVLGAVGKPGSYEMLGARSLLQVLAQAGGLTEQVGPVLYVIPGSTEAGDRHVVNVADLMANRDPALNLDIRPGDIVSVPMERQLYIYVDGAVKTPGRIEQPSSRPLTLLQAIAKAGGPTERANLKKVQILRQGDGGVQQAIAANVQRIKKGEDPDPILFDGDVVAVAETFF